MWALAAASALFWGLRLFAASRPLPERTPVAARAPAARGDLVRLLGADPPPPVVQAEAEPPPDNRFQLIGVVAGPTPSAAREGVALIAVDGKAPKAFRVGAVVEGQTVLKTVAARGATLGPRDGPAQVTLNLAPVAPAATGTLPTAAAEMPTAPGQLRMSPPTAPRFIPPTAALPVQPQGALPQMGPQAPGQALQQQLQRQQLQQQQQRQLQAPEPAPFNRRVLPPPLPSSDPAQEATS